MADDLTESASVANEVSREALFLTLIGIVFQIANWA